MPSSLREACDPARRSRELDVLTRVTHEMLLEGLVNRRHAGVERVVEFLDDAILEDLSPGAAANLEQLDDPRQDAGLSAERRAEIAAVDRVLRAALA